MDTVKRFSTFKGFTLLELLVVFGIIGILTGISIASYSTFNNTQSLQSAVRDVQNMLSTAKSRAISQVKPDVCGEAPLSGYQVVFSNPSYTLQVVCGDTNHIIKTQSLPMGVSFAGGSAATVFFAISQGTSAPSVVTLSGYGKTKNITISSTGNIGTN